jgi:hypothetical protein
VRLDLGGSRIGTTVLHRLELGALLSDGTADLTLRGAIDSGTVRAAGRARLFDSLPTYRLSGSATGMPGTAALARALTGATGNPSLAVAFRIAGAGSSPTRRRPRDAWISPRCGTQVLSVRSGTRRCGSRRGDWRFDPRSWPAAAR